ncbi:MAG: ribonuclease III [Lachnospirales bacterium]
MFTELQKKLNYNFKNINILVKAFNHSSAINEKKEKPIESNQRLEFLGDAVLELSMSTYLFHEFPNMLEGDLTKLRASLVCEPSLAKIARKLTLDKYIKMSKGEILSKGNNRDSVLADCMEAVFGAIYEDSNYTDASKVIINLLREEVGKNFKTFQTSDYKTALQEHIQGYSQVPIIYKIIDESGPDHNKVFFVEVYHDDKLLGKGQGKSKKEAEQNSAKEALITFNVL